mmetsp:Transcript_59180/g.183617  ORF Transcript_59180/g.183617 Transcript_59180/m.183617 type:complete len:210 (+) Transcript_59180:739-1368(+)
MDTPVELLEGGVGHLAGHRHPEGVLEGDAEEASVPEHPRAGVLESLAKTFLVLLGMQVLTERHLGGDRLHPAVQKRREPRGSPCHDQFSIEADDGVAELAQHFRDRIQDVLRILYLQVAGHLCCHDSGHGEEHHNYADEDDGLADDKLRHGGAGGHHLLEHRIVDRHQAVDFDMPGQLHGGPQHLDALLHVPHVVQLRAAVADHNGALG